MNFTLYLPLIREMAERKKVDLSGFITIGDCLIINKILDDIEEAELWARTFLNQ